MIRWYDIPKLSRSRLVFVPRSRGHRGAATGLEKRPDNFGAGHRRSAAWAALRKTTALFFREFIGKP